MLLCALGVSHCPLSVAPGTIARQAPLSMGFSSQDQWSALPSPTPEDLRKPGCEPVSPAFPALAGRFLTTEPPGKPGFNFRIPERHPDLQLQPSPSLEPQAWPSSYQLDGSTSAATQSV